MPLLAAEDGTISAFVAVLAVALVAVAGLAYDGGQIIRATADARDLASAAARAGTQQLAIDQVHAGRAWLDPAAADQAARDYLTGIGASGTVAVTDTDVSVTVAVPGDDATATVAVEEDDTAAPVGGGGGPIPEPEETPEPEPEETPEPEPEETPEPEPEETPEPEPEDTPVDTPDEETPEEPAGFETPGFGVVVALIALLAAALIAARRDR